MTTSCWVPLAWSKASSTTIIPSSRLSRSMLSAASLRVKGVNVGSYRFVHGSKGSSCAGEWLPPNVRARDDSPSVLSTTATTSGDPSVASPSVRPTSGAVTWATSGMGHATTLCTTTVASSYVPPITATATSACVGGVLTGGVVPTAVGATSVFGSSICPIVGSGIAAIAGCFATSEGIP